MPEVVVSERRFSEPSRPFGGRGSGSPNFTVFVVILAAILIAFVIADTMEKRDAEIRSLRAEVAVLEQQNLELQDHPDAANAQIYAHPEVFMPALSASYEPTPATYQTYVERYGDEILSVAKMDPFLDSDGKEILMGGRPARYTGPDTQFNHIGVGDPRPESGPPSIASLPVRQVADSPSDAGVCGLAFLSHRALFIFSADDEECRYAILPNAIVEP